MLTKEQRDGLRRQLIITGGNIAPDGRTAPALLDSLDEMERREAELLSHINALVNAGAEARNEARKCLAVYGWTL